MVLFEEAEHFPDREATVLGGYKARGQVTSLDIREGSFRGHAGQTEG